MKKTTKKENLICNGCIKAILHKGEYYCELKFNTKITDYAKVTNSKNVCDFFRLRDF